MLTTVPAYATNVGDGELDGDLTRLDLISTNDFHGHFAKDFACAVTTMQREQPGTTLLSAGDNIGGTPFESASQNDEPAIDYFSSLDLKVSSVGNHEFDKGITDLTGRVQSRADWTYVGANVYQASTTTHALPEYKVVEQNGVQVAVVGAVTKDVPSLVAKDGIKGLDVGDPVTQSTASPPSAPTARPATVRPTSSSRSTTRARRAGSRRDEPGRRTGRAQRVG